MNQFFGLNEGGLNRRGFVLLLLLNTALFLLLAIWLNDEDVMSLSCVPAFVLLVFRIKHRGRSWGLAFLALVPIIGLWIVFEALFLPRMAPVKATSTP